MQKLRGWDGAAPAVAFAAGLLVASSMHGLGPDGGALAVGAVALVCSVGVRLRTAALVALLSWLLVTGFDVHRWGELTPLAGADGVRLLVLALAAAAVALVSRPLLARRAAVETGERGDRRPLKSPSSLVSATSARPR
jgi:hypothetical protein